MKKPTFSEVFIAKAYRLLTSIHMQITYSLARAFHYKGTIKHFNKFEKRIHTQGGEAGLIQTIFDKIGTTNKQYVEFGVRNGTECNARFLREQGWDGLMMDNNEGNPDHIKNEFITAENINDLFKKYKVPKEFDLLSIDIDGNDYWVWKKLDAYKPRVVVIEYNAFVPPSMSKTIKYDAKHMWDRTRYFGASLLALYKLGKSKGYELIGCSNNGANAFFVRKDVLNNTFVTKTAKEAYRKPNWGMLNSDMKKSDKKMVTV